MEISNVVVFFGRSESVQIEHGAIFIQMNEYDADRMNKLVSDAMEQAATLPDPVYDDEPKENYIERRERELKEYEATPEGQKALKSWNKIQKAWEKYGNGGMNYNLMEYLDVKCKMDFMDISFDSYKVGYIAGMNKQKKLDKLKG